MNVIITGSLGLLGQRVAKRSPKNAHLLCLDLPKCAKPLEQKNYASCDLTQRDAIRKQVESFSPDWIINCAAYTAVDQAEDEREACWNMNVNAVDNIAYAARKANSRVLHISSDYIFNGQGGPYTEEDTPDPIGFYGKSKLAAENVLRGAPIAAAIIRTMVLYGPTENNRPDFVKWLIQTLDKGQEVKIVDDQIGNATLNDNLADAIWEIIGQEFTGLVNVAGREIGSRLDFAYQIADIFELDSNLISPIKTLDLQQKAPRPLNSGFYLDKAQNELGLELYDNSTALLYLKNQLRRVKT